MARELSAQDVRRMRWHAQRLGGSELTPGEVVERMVALQGQDLQAVMRAIALRSRPETTLDDVRDAFDRGELVRSWPMRGTLFATTPHRLSALLHHTADRIHRAAARRREQLGLDDATITRARETLHSALAERPRRRAEALELWRTVGIDTAGGRGYHLIMHLAVDGVCWWGPFDEAGAEQLLAAATLEAPAEPDAALARVVHDYTAARGPVMLDDLAWWTKLPKSLLRRAADDADVTEVSAAGAAAWIAEAEPEAAPRPSGVTLVPAFDEWILGYADRSLVAGDVMLDALVPGRNGVFRPAVLVDGVVVGTWKSAGPRKREGPRAELVEPVAPRVRERIDAALTAWPHP